MPGVAAASTEISLPATVTTGDGDDAETDTAEALVIDPVSYAAAHESGGALSGLGGRGVAAGPGGDIPSHGNVRLQLPDDDLGEVPVVAAW